MKTVKWICGVVALAILSFGAEPGANSTFVNPIYEGADPFVFKHTDGFYYFCQSEGDRGIAVWKSDRLTDKGVKRLVWKAPDSGWNSKEVWAPELHYLQGKWYIYYAADDGNNRNHRTGVLQSKTRDPQGDYRDMGAVYTGDEIESGKNSRWAIDATPLEMNGKLYLIWSGWNGADDDVQSLFIAEMENPWTIKSDRVKITPNNTYAWECVSDSPGNKGLNEGPEVLRHGDRIFVIYSCSGSWETTYKLGQLSIREGKDPMNPDNWVKKDSPVFQGTDTVHGVGHCCFTKSPDGTEDWMVYHSKIGTSPGWQRNVRIEKFGWNGDGSPCFPVPTTEGTVLEKPSGEKPPVAGTFFNDSFDNGQWDNWQYFGYNRFVAVRNRALALGIDPGWGTANNYRCGEKAIVRGLVWEDFAFSSTMAILEGDRDAGLIFRVMHPAVGYDAMKGYFAGIIPGRNQAVLGKMNGKEWTEIASAALPVEAGREYVLKVVTQGDKIQFSVDGKPVIETTDSSYGSGYAGVRVVNVDASFDNIEIRAR